MAPAHRSRYSAVIAWRVRALNRLRPSNPRRRRFFNRWQLRLLLLFQVVVNRRLLPPPLRLGSATRNSSSCDRPSTRTRWCTSGSINRRMRRQRRRLLLLRRWVRFSSYYLFMFILYIQSKPLNAISVLCGIRTWINTYIWSFKF